MIDFKWANMANTYKPQHSDWDTVGPQQTEFLLLIWSFAKWGLTIDSPISVQEMFICPSQKVLAQCKKASWTTSGTVEWRNILLSWS